MGEGYPAEEGGGEWNRAEQQGPQQVGADEYGLTGESINPHACELAHHGTSDEVDRRKGGRFGCVDPEANDRQEGRAARVMNDP